jgi:hypothetical protein
MFGTEFTGCEVTALSAFTWSVLNPVLASPLLLLTTTPHAQLDNRRT